MPFMIISQGLKHFLDVLGLKRPLDLILISTLQGYINNAPQEKSEMLFSLSKP